MREILFRGFHPCDGPEIIVVDGEKVKGKWVEGYIVKHPSAIQIGNDYSPWYIHVPPVDPDDNGGVFNVLPSSVGQYTGLTDRTGKRIFEGDILKTNKYGKDDGKGHNSAGSDAFCVAFEDGGYCLKNEWRRFNLRTDVDAKVIGTVFDEEAQHDN